MNHPDQAQLIQLRETLAKHFSLSELQDLCFDLGINFDNLSGSAQNDKVRDLLLVCIRQNRVVELVAHGKRIRSDIAWDMTFSPQPTQQIHSSDPEVLNRRRFFYEELHRILKPFARYDLPEPIAIETLKRITVAMRDWYFDVGGLYLTDRSRGPYFNLKEEIKTVIEDPHYQSTAYIHDEDYQRLLKAASQLRARLREDLNTT